MSTIINTESEISHRTQNSIQLGGVFEDLKHQSNVSSMPCDVEGDHTERSLMNMENDSSASANVKYKETNVNIERVVDQYIETDSYVCNSMEDMQLDSCVPNKNSSSTGLPTNLETKMKDNALFDNSSEVNDSSQKSLSSELLIENDNVLNIKQSNLEDGQSSNLPNDHHQNDLDFSALEQSMEVSYEKKEKIDQTLDSTTISENNLKNSDASASSELDHSNIVEAKVEFVDNKFVSEALAEDGDEWQMDGQWAGNGELAEGETKLLKQAEEDETDLMEQANEVETEQLKEVEDHNLKRVGQLEQDETDQLDEAGPLDEDEADQLEEEAGQLEEEESGRLEEEEAGRLEEEEAGRLEEEEAGRLEEEEGGRLVEEGAGQLEGDEAGQLEDDEAGQLEDDEAGQLEDDEAGQLEDDEVGQLEDDEVGQLEDDEVGQLEDDEVGQLEDDEVGQLEDDEVGQLEDDEVGQLEDDEVGQLEDDEVGQLEDDEVGQLEDDGAGQLEDDKAGQIEIYKTGQLEGGESGQLEALPLRGKNDQLGEGKSDQLEEGETVELEGYHIEEDETNQLEETETDQLVEGEVEQLVKSKDEKEPNLIEDGSSSQLDNQVVKECVTDELQMEKSSYQLEKGVTDKMEEEVKGKGDKDDITQQQMKIKDVESEFETVTKQATKGDNENSTITNVLNKVSNNDEPTENVVDDDADVDDILDKISKEDALGKSGLLSDSHEEEVKFPQDVEMSEDISKNDVVIEDSDDDDFDPISLLAVEHSTPDEPMDTEFSKKIGLCNSDDSRPSSVVKFAEANIDQNVDSLSGSSLLKSDESVDEESQDSVDLKEPNVDIDKIVMMTIEEIINKTVCIVDVIPEHFFYSSHKRKKLGFVKEGTVEEVMDEIVSKVSAASKKLAKEVAKATKANEAKTLEKEDSNQNNLDNQKGFKNCTECGSNKGLKYQVLFHGRTCFLCSDHCFKIFRSKQNLAPPPPGLTRPTESCSVCRVEIKNGQGYFPLDTDGKSVCSEECIRQYQQMHGAKQTCAQCKKDIEGRTKCLSWETMEFCNEDCLGKYQQFLGSYCACCKSPVQRLSLGKYCVRFGSDIRQFCSGKCLEEFKRGLKVCTFCQKDLTGCTDGFLAPVGTKGVFKDFCSQQCLSQYETVNSAAGSVPKTKKCSVCQKIGPIKAQVVFNKQEHTLCSDPCVAAFRYANKITNKICDTCHKFFKSESSPLQFEGASKRFCGKTCMNLFVLSHRKIVPCTWCKVKKYNFDMIERVDSNNHVQLFCSLNCLSLFRVSLNATSSRSVCCDHCHNNLPAQYHLTMSDASIRNFCTYQCVIQFQSQFTSVPTLTTVTPTIRNQTVPQAAPTPQVVTPPQPVPVNKPVSISNATPVISSVISLAPGSLGPVRPTQATLTNVNNISTAVNSLTGASFIPQSAQVNFTPFVNKVQAVQATPAPPPQPQAPTTVQVIREIVVKPPMPKITKNKMVLCKPSMQTKGVACKPHPCHKCTQTEEPEPPPPTYVPIPIPVPIFVPVPMHMYSRTVPCPTPFPIPIPVPIFLPTTKSTTEQIMQHINDIRERTPDNPFEAELLMMAEMVAAQEEESDEKLKENHNLAPNIDNNDYDGLPSMSLGGSSADNSLGHEFAEFTEPILDLETALIPPQYDPPNLIEAPASVVSSLGDESSSDVLTPREQRMRQRNSASSKRRNSSGGRAIRGGRGRKKARLTESLHCSEDSSEPYVSGNETSFSEPIQRIATVVGDSQSPDANLCLKFMFGVNAWKHWVVQKNNQLERGSQSRKLKLFKTDLLQLTADELNYSLCLFVKEVRKPNGEEYAPDSIYYLCLGIQMYIFENGRVDNIFTDSYYEKFTECLNEVVQKQEMAVMREGRYVSRIEEEILWESKQLGAHSPHVLLNTLMYFNTKHFGLRNVNDHALLSFSHIIKHYKKDLTPEHGANKVLASTPGKLAVLRYYPPSKDAKRNRKEEVVYEQVENLHNVLRCPVKLYEFYLSKCPDSIRTRSDVFYLYPERSCVPDSPVWYSMQPLGRDTLSKMIHRIRMVREINRPNLVD